MTEESAKGWNGSKDSKDGLAEHHSPSHSPDPLCPPEADTPSTSLPGTPTSVLPSPDETNPTPTLEGDAESGAPVLPSRDETNHSPTPEGDPETVLPTRDELNHSPTPEGDPEGDEDAPAQAPTEPSVSPSPTTPDVPGTCSRPTSSLHVLTWNLLAHQFTASVKKFHLTESETGRESPAQTAARYATAATAILKQLADVVLLQECSAAFLAPEPKLNPHAVTLQSHYRAYCCFGADGAPADRRKHPGCAILLRRASPIQLLDLVAVDGCDDFGGKHYSGIALLLHTMALGKVWVATVHQCHESPPHIPTPKKRQGKRGALLRALHAAMAAKDGCQRIILGGDFGASGEPALDRELLDLEEVERCTWLGRGMHRVLCRVPVTLRQFVYERDRTTGLSPSWQYDVSLDYFYVSPDLEVPFVRTNGLPRCPYARDVVREDWKGSAVVAASDHVWLEVEVRCCDSQPVEAPPLNRTTASVWNVPILSVGRDASDGVPWQWIAPPPNAPVSPSPSGGSNGFPPPARSPPPPAAVPVPVAGGSQRGRRLKMVRARFGLNVGEVATVVGESKTHSSWMLDSGCTVLKTHEGVSWVWLDRP